MAANALFIHANDLHWRLEVIDRLRTRTNRLLTRNFPEGYRPHIQLPEDLHAMAPLANNHIFDWLCSVSPATRDHMFYSDQRKTVTTEYGLRSFGIDDNASARAIIESGLFAVESSEEAAQRLVPKAVLLAICREHGIDHRKSWKKAAILTATWAHTNGRSDVIGKTPLSLRIQRHPNLLREWAELMEYKQRAAALSYALVAL